MAVQHFFAAAVLELRELPLALVKPPPVELPPPPEPKLHLPEPNTLIATDFSMRSAPSDHACLPSLIVCTPQLSLWYLYDDIFHKPKANLLINCLSSVAYESPVSAVLTQLFVMMICWYSSDRGSRTRLIVED